MQRRAFLKRATAIVASSVVTTGGCLSGDDGESSPAPVDGPAYSGWFFTPHSGTDDYGFLYQTSTFFEQSGTPIEIGSPFDAIDQAEIESWLTVVYGGPSETSASVVSGQFDPDAVGERLESSGFEATEEYEGYDLYAQSGSVIGLSEQHVLSGPKDEDTNSVHRFIDARNGEVDRYQDTNTDFGEILDAVGDADYAVGQAGPGSDLDYENQVGGGGTVDIQGETTDATIIYLFDSAENVPIDAIREEATTPGLTFPGLVAYADEVNVEQDGRMAVGSMTVDTSALEEVF